MTDFSVSDISGKLDEPTRRVMLDLILAWARYDSLVSQWLLYAYGLSPDGGSILLGNMGTRTKLERIKDLYQHHGMKSAVSRIAHLQKGHATFVDYRNAIAHYGCGGQNTSKPEFVLFAPVKTQKGHVGKMLMEQLSVRMMVTATLFAEEMGDQLRPFVEPFLALPSTPPPEPPQFLGESPTTLRTKPKNKRRSRPQS